MKKKITDSSLRMVALIILLAGAGSSLFLMFNAGRHQKSILLIILFTGWVLSPFIGLFITDMMSKHWLSKVRESLYFLTIFITLASLIVYSGVLNVPGTKPAFKFLIVPLISWILILIIITIIRKRSFEKGSKNSV